MINMRMADKDIAQPQHGPRGQRRNITEIEKKRTPLEQQIDIKRRVTIAVIDELRMESGAHRSAANPRDTVFHGALSDEHMTRCWLMAPITRTRRRRREERHAAPPAHARQAAEPGRYRRSAMVR